MRNHTHKAVGYDIVTRKNCIKYRLSLYWTSSNYSGSVWYVCLKIENCCLKTFVKIRVGEKVC